MKLNDGSAIQITNGKYFLSNSQTAWEGIGIIPDHVVVLGYTPDFTDITLLDASIDTQLSKAIEVVSSYIVEEPQENTEDTTENVEESNN